MELKMRNGVLTVIGENKTIEVDIVDGELEVIGDFVVEEEEAEDGVEEVIEFEDEPDMPTNSKRDKHYPLIKGLKVGDKVRLRLDLDEAIDDIEKVFLVGFYDRMLQCLAGRDLIIEETPVEYDEISDQKEVCLLIDDWYLSTRWVIKVEELEKEETYL